MPFRLGGTSSFGDLVQELPDIPGTQRKKKSCITSRRTINIIKILATGQQQHSHTWSLSPWGMGPGSFQDHLGAQSCETLRNIAIIHWNWVPGAQIVGHIGMSQNNPNHITFNTIILDPILDLTTRFLLPEAGWGAVPLVGEACDQPGGSNRVVME